MSMELTIKYANGNELKHVVNYAHVENGSLFYTVKRQAVFLSDARPVEVPLKNIISFDIEETEKQFN